MKSDKKLRNRGMNVLNVFEHTKTAALMIMSAGTNSAKGMWHSSKNTEGGRSLKQPMKADFN